MDVLAIRHWSETEFGPLVAGRYLALIAQAYADLCRKPDQTGASLIPGLREGYWLYPIRNSLAQLRREDRVRTARHVVAFRYDDEKVLIARVLHDAMDIPSRLA